ncbi:UDP-glucose 4-epimerase GalE [Peptostreptococcus canis]|uniref:UDP-glucose 4-epimerase n=1 Tax=Peptostreptococcus canis TaxID=1159213 RepID=A0ABR6TKJ2_9FIRM|nr:UDP-glucose 4-epimerase GalE [Peptostreptococcus canis]MBC2575924.1 UDP-glucose 4-epimerase GalE [Peptostreptococcus canis]MBP1997955.1 UDP-glucose 4-epimerase [Peptostreptococcus canis]
MGSILLAGGAGYIGSHTAVELLENGYDIIIADNFSNSYPIVIERIEKITSKKVRFYEVDTRSEEFEKIFIDNTIDVVVDFAAYKAVGDSVKQPLKYYDNNLFSLINTLKLMRKYNINNFVFSSSATVYGDVPKEKLPVDERNERTSTNPYGSTKLMGEMIIEDICHSDDKFNSIILRYFNPIGAHKSGLIGEETVGIPANIMPYLTKVAIGELPNINVFGNDYDTIDGTGVRDYIHVVDLARGHVKAIERLLKENTSVEHYNLGTGNGYSVMELISAFSKACGKEIPFKVVERRNGDSASSFADANKAKQILGWNAIYDIDDMCKDSWNWQVNNPKGYTVD